MSIWPAPDSACSTCPSTPAIATIIDARPRDIDGFRVRRLLPSVARRLVGPLDEAARSGRQLGQCLTICSRPRMTLT